MKKILVTAIIIIAPALAQASSSVCLKNVFKVDVKDNVTYVYDTAEKAIGTNLQFCQTTQFYKGDGSAYDRSYSLIKIKEIL